MAHIPLDNITKVMALDPAPRTYAELDHLVTSGLPRSALLACVARLCEGEDKKRVMQQISRGATGQHPHDCLSAAESACVVRLARIVATAEYVWSSRNDAKAFLNHDHPMLEGKSPVEIAQTEIGARRVENLLWHIFYGVVS